jgi:hypothetical protein
MNLTDSDWELYEQLVHALYAMPPRERRTAHWAMSQEWAGRIAAMELPGLSGTVMPAVWAHMPDRVLLSKPVKVAEDAGEPHMEAEPQRDGVLAELDQEVVYIKCDDPACPKHKPGLHHAHLQR